MQHKQRNVSERELGEHEKVLRERKNVEKFISSSAHRSKHYHKKNIFKNHKIAEIKLNM